MLSSVARIPVAALVLGLAGVIPFVAGAIAQWVPVPRISAQLGLTLVVVYGAIILSFLGGIRWGTAIGPFDGRRQGIEFGGSVLGSLVGLAAIFMAPVGGLTVLISAFLLQALWDVISVEAGRLPQWFGRLRMILTTGAVLAMLATLLAQVI